MQHREGRSAQAVQRGRSIQIAYDRHDAARAKLRDFVVAPSEAVQTRASAQQGGGAKRDVAAADQQNPDHSDSIFTRAPIARLARNAETCRFRLP